MDDNVMFDDVDGEEDDIDDVRASASLFLSIYIISTHTHDAENFVALFEIYCKTL